LFDVIDDEFLLFFAEVIEPENFATSLRRTLHHTVVLKFVRRYDRVTVRAVVSNNAHSYR
jgi:hypothetical protein